MNRNILKITSGLLCGVVALTGVLETSKISLANDVNISSQTNQKSLSGKIIERDGKAFVVVTAKLNARNISVNVTDENGVNYTFTHKEIKTGETIEFEIPTTSAKVLPKTSVVRESISFTGKALSKNYSAKVSYDIDRIVAEREDVDSEKNEIKKEEKAEKNKDEVEDLYIDKEDVNLDALKEEARIDISALNYLPMEEKEFTLNLISKMTSAERVAEIVMLAQNRDKYLGEISENNTIPKENTEKPKVEVVIPGTDNTVNVENPKSDSEKKEESKEPTKTEDKKTPPTPTEVTDNKESVSPEKGAVAPDNMKPAISDSEKEKAEDETSKTGPTGAEVTKPEANPETDNKAEVEKEKKEDETPGKTPLTPDTVEPATPQPDAPKDPSDEAKSTETNKDAKTDFIASLKAVVLKNLNDLRAKNGMASLTENVELTKIADIRAKDQAAIDTLDGHAGFDPALNASNYLKTKGGNGLSAGENLYYSARIRSNQFNEEEKEKLAKEIAAEVVNAWYLDLGTHNENKGHRKNMINPNWDEVGTGIEIEEELKDGNYWYRIFVAQNYGRTKDIAHEEVDYYGKYLKDMKAIPSAAPENYEVYINSDAVKNVDSAKQLDSRKEEYEKHKQFFNEGKVTAADLAKYEKHKEVFETYQP